MHVRSCSTVTPREESLSGGATLDVVAVPNVSEGRDGVRIQELARAVRRGGARVLDMHSDPWHNRSVFTVAAEPGEIATSMAGLAVAARDIDLRRHVGVHPRLGGLDVCPVVAFRIDLAEATAIALATARAVAARAQLPVYLYGAAARRPETRELPDLRRGGLGQLAARARAGLTPDLGPSTVELRRGVVCVGARGPLIAFNVWLECRRELAQRIASEVRSSGGGPPAVRALGVRVGDRSQVSMNLIDPAVTGIDTAFEAVAARARTYDVPVVATEIVGLVPARHRPRPDKQAARLLTTPGRTLESALAD